MSNHPRAQNQSSFRLRSALTIVEVLAALALASVLMVALLGVLRSWSIQKQVLASKYAPALWQVQLEQQLRWDLQNARQISVAGGELRLEGYASREFATGSPTLRPAEVIYHAQAVEAGGLLLRSVRNIDETERQRWITELVCTDVAELQVTEPVFIPGEQHGSEIQFTQQPVPMPAQLYVRLYRPGEEQPVFERLIHLR